MAAYVGSIMPSMLSRLMSSVSSSGSGSCCSFGVLGAEATERSFLANLVSFFSLLSLFKLRVECEAARVSRETEAGMLYSGSGGTGTWAGPVESVRMRDLDRLLRRLRLNSDDFDLRGPWVSYESSGRWGTSGSSVEGHLGASKWVSDERPGEALLEVLGRKEMKERDGLGEKPKRECFWSGEGWRKVRKQSKFEKKRTESSIQGAMSAVREEEGGRRVSG